MRVSRIASFVAALAASWFCAFAIPSPAIAEELTARSLPLDHIAYPEGKAHSVVVLLSDADGWSESEARLSGTLNKQGAIVVGVDLPSYYDALRREEDRSCLYLVSDIERIGKQLHRRAGIAAFHPPVIAGHGAGATLALAIAAQTPVSTITRTIAVDPGKVIPLTKPLCTPAQKTPVNHGIIYGLTKGSLPNPVTISLTATAPKEGREHAEALKESHPELRFRTSKETRLVALESALERAIEGAGDEDVSLDLPLIEVPTPARHDVFAIIYSGDGGWRDIDRKLGFHLQKAGVPVVGIDALKYFWSERTPEETAADLSRIIHTYKKRFGAKRVALIGYSFGADILPVTYAALDPASRRTVLLVSLLALSRAADFEIAVTGWLGMAGEGRYGDPVDHIGMAMPPSVLQCIYGSAEKESGCLALNDLAARGADIVERPGGHHFDGKYDVIADHILQRLQ